MAPLTRWVLAHERIVVCFWVSLTLVGMVSAGRVEPSPSPHAVQPRTAAEGAP